MDFYDSHQYESIPFPETHPNNLAVLGSLFGLKPADPARARVLELGCATGGNLIPMAWYLPDAEFVGYDLSAAQIDSGNTLIERTGLRNIRLQQGDILQLDASLGQFDYIIAHGVYSWVPPQVRQHLLGLYRQLLAPQGMGYISYNSLPGWRMRGMLRDILLHACRDSHSAVAKLETAAAALQRLEAGLQSLDTLHARYLKHELKSLKGAHPTYLLNEYLADFNQPFLLSEFVADSKQHGLRYLCDTSLHTLIPSALGEGVEAALADIQNSDETEQWLDFYRGRNFRQSLLCQQEAEVSYEIDLEDFEHFALSCELTPLHTPQLRSDSNDTFSDAYGTRFEVENPLAKAAILELSQRYPDAITAADLLPLAQARLQQANASQFAGDVNGYLSDLFNLFVHEAFSVQPTTASYAAPDLRLPQANALARAQAELGWNQIATLHHAGIDLDAFSRRLLHHLDGQSSLDDVINLLLDDMHNGALQAPDNLAAQSLAQQRQLIEQNCSNLLGIFARNGILL